MSVELNSDQVSLCHGRMARLRPAVEKDAELMLTLRQTPEYTQYIPALDIDLEAQKKWIRSNVGNPLDWTFAVDRIFDGKTEGFLGLYGIRDRQAEWGRWVMREGSVVGLEAVFLLHRLAFEGIGLSRIYSLTIQENRRVVSFHDKYGAKRKAVLRGAKLLRGQTFDVVEHEITLAAWPEIRNKHAMLLRLQ